MNNLKIDVLIITPSNIIHMPYLNNYINILDSLDIKYKIINWDRNHIEEESSLKYRNKSIGVKKRYLEYRNYYKFVQTKIEDFAPEKIIIFGIQLGYFLNKVLIKNYKDKYILDIRDKNLMMYFYNLNKLIENSKYTVISSEGYRRWLLGGKNYLVNHNINIDNLDSEMVPPSKKGKIKIGTVGTIRDKNINLKLINEVSKSKNLSACFYGDGSVKETLEYYVTKERKDNVLFYGRYKKNEEKEIVNSCDFISVLRLPDSSNNKSALPNRLYSGALYGKPLLAFEGTYLAQVIKMFKLGVVVDTLDNLELTLQHYQYWLVENWKEYLSNRENFFRWVLSDNEKFKSYLTEFLLD